MGAKPAVWVSDRARGGDENLVGSMVMKTLPWTLIAWLPSFKVTASSGAMLNVSAWEQSGMVTDPAGGGTICDGG